MKPCFEFQIVLVWCGWVLIFHLWNSMLLLIITYINKSVAKELFVNHMIFLCNIKLINEYDELSGVWSESNWGKLLLDCI